MRICHSIVSRYCRLVALPALVLVVSCTHVGHGPVQVVNVESPPPEKAGAKIAPRAFESMRAILEQTAAVVEGDVSDIAFDFDDCAGPRTKVKVVNAHSVLGTTVTTEIVLSIFGGPTPDGHWFRASEMPRFALGSRYVFFIRNTDWTFAPIIGELAYRLETIAGRSVLVNGNGQAVTGLSETGIETNTVPLTEPTGNRYRALRPEAGRGGQADHGESDRVPTVVGTADGELLPPSYGPSPREITASGQFARPAILPTATGDAVKDALTPAAFIAAIKQNADREQVRVGGYLALQPLWRCWAITPAHGKRGVSQ